LVFRRPFEHFVGNVKQTEFILRECIPVYLSRHFCYNANSHYGATYWWSLEPDRLNILLHCRNYATYPGYLLFWGNCCWFPPGLSLGPRAVEIENYGCYFNPSPQFNLLQVCIVEFMGAICVIAMMYGESVLLFHIILVFRILTLSEGFNTSPGPQDQNPFHSITPLLNGISLGLVGCHPFSLSTIKLIYLFSILQIVCFATSDFAPANSYGGATGFPTRCWASSAAIFKFEPNDWVFWLPAMAAAALHGLAYRFLNPCVDESVNSSLADLTTNYTLNSSSAGLPMSDVIIHMNASESCEIKDKR
ncbi:hypothetical protein PSTT_09368, partial [Puccinia striiformis]